MKLIYATLITLMTTPAWAHDFSFLELGKTPEIRVEMRRQQAIDLIKALNQVGDRNLSNSPHAVNYEVSDHFLTGRDILVTVTRTVYDQSGAQFHCDYKVEILEKDRTSLHLEACQKGLRPAQKLATKTQFFYDDANPFTSAHALENESTDSDEEKLIEN